jgi:hypothetical protein
MRTISRTRMGDLEFARSGVEFALTSQDKECDLSRVTYLITLLAYGSKLFFTFGKVFMSRFVRAFGDSLVVASISGKEAESTKKRASG